MIEYNTIANMKSATVPVNGQLAYVKGYFAAGDGGGGMFIYNSSNSQEENQGTIFIPNANVKTDPTPDLNGRWLRQYSGYMNVEYFGVQRGWDTPYTGFSNSDRIQMMIDYASSSNIGSAENDVTIFFPNGQYFIDKTLILKSEVRLLGGPATNFTNKGDVYDYMFKLDAGPVVRLRMENFIINLNNQAGVGGLHIKGLFPDPSQSEAGGLWDAVFRNIYIMNGLGIGIYLEGGEGTTATTPTSNWLLPNQFMVFDNVRVRRSTGDYPALKLTGQNANYTFLNCEFRNTEGLTLNGPCIHISSVNSGTSYGERMSTNAVSFINSGFGGYARYGAIIEDSTNITFDTCFCEGNDDAFLIKNSQQVQVINSRFANSAGAGSLGSNMSVTGNAGNIIKAENSVVNVWNNHMTVTAQSDYAALANQYFIRGVGNNNVFNVQNNTFSLPGLSKTFGIMQTSTVDSNALANNTTYGTIHIGGKKLVFVTVPASPTSVVSRIDSDICAGETVFIRANGGPIQFMAMNALNETQGRNIFLNGRASVTLSNGQGATFVKIDNIIGNENCSYQLVSVAN